MFLEQWVWEVSFWDCPRNSGTVGKYDWYVCAIANHPLKWSPVSERSAYPLKKYVCFSLLTSGLERYGHKSTPSGLKPTVQNCSYVAWKWVGPRMVNFLECLGQGSPGCYSISSLSSGASTAPWTFLLTTASYIFILNLHVMTFNILYELLLLFLFFFLLFF